MININNKLIIFVIVLLTFILWFTLVSSFIDIFRMSFAISNMQDIYTGVELSTNLLFFNLNNDLRLEGIQIAIAGGFLLIYFSKKKI